MNVQDWSKVVLTPEVPVGDDRLTYFEVFQTVSAKQ